MKESLFVQYISKIFPKLGTLIEKVNGKRKNLTYLHKEMLRREYSADHKWTSAAVNTTYVAADMVALDSPLPIKKRDSLGKANGELPKIGLKYKLSESQINEVNIMIAQGAKFEQIAKKLINDSVKCSVGIDEKLEAAFLEGLSEGAVGIADENNVGVAYRADFGYLPDNCFGVSVEGHIAKEDVENVISRADAKGVTLNYLFIADSTYKALKQETWAKELVANYNGVSYSNPTNLPVPTASKFNEAFADEFGGIEINVVNRSVQGEKNGKSYSYKPWNADKLIFLPTKEVGALVWATLAEVTNPVSGVVYEVVDEFKLISKYSKNDPLEEFTSGQALVLPVIEGVDQIFSLDIKDSQAVDTTAEGSDTGDVTVTVWGETYTKSGFVAALAALGVKVSATATDATIIKKVNALSNEEEEKLKELAESALVESSQS